MNAKKEFEDKGYFRRQYPRRALKRKVGVLCDGTYFVCETQELGEGGMSIVSEFILTEGHELVVSLQIPSGDFVFLRATVRSTKKQEGDTDGRVLIAHGLSFSDIAFSIKRQIRAFVSARTESSASTSTTSISNS